MGKVGGNVFSDFNVQRVFSFASLCPMTQDTNRCGVWSGPGGGGHSGVNGYPLPKGHSERGRSTPIGEKRGGGAVNFKLRTGAIADNKLVFPILNCIRYMAFLV